VSLPPLECLSLRSTNKALQQILLPLHTMQLIHLGLIGPRGEHLLMLVLCGLLLVELSHCMMRISRHGFLPWARFGLKTPLLYSSLFMPSDCGLIKALLMDFFEATP
jgi:hypothetical protein